MKSIKVLLVRLMQVLNRIEGQFNESLAVVLFGPAAELEYEDIPLPSERKNEQETAKPSSSDKRKKRFRGFRLGSQLKLFTIGTSKRLLLKLILASEGIIRSSSKKSNTFNYENSYK